MIQTCKKIAELERMVGLLTVELNAAKKAYTSLSPTYPGAKTICSPKVSRSWLRYQLVCQLLQLPRSSFYYQAHPGSFPDEVEVVEHLQKLAGKWVRYGYRRLSKQLHREGRKVNSKRVSA